MADGDTAHLFTGLTAELPTALLTALTMTDLAVLGNDLEAERAGRPHGKIADLRPDRLR